MLCVNKQFIVHSLHLQEFISKMCGKNLVFFFDKIFIEKSTIDSNKTCNNENLAIKHLVAILQIQNLTRPDFDWDQYQFALFNLIWIIVENVKEYGNSS